MEFLNSTGTEHGPMEFFNSIEHAEGGLQPNLPYHVYQMQSIALLRVFKGVVYVLTTMEGHYKPMLNGCSEGASVVNRSKSS